jgi:hypothetical protein
MGMPFYRLSIKFSLYTNHKLWLASCAGMNNFSYKDFVQYPTLEPSTFGVLG